MSIPPTSPGPTAPPTVADHIARPGSAKDWRSGYIRYLRSPVGRAEFHVGTPWVRYAIAAPLILSVMAAPIGIGLAVGGVLRSSRRRREHEAVQRWAANAVPIETFPLMVNTALLRRRGAVAPGLVMGCFAQKLDAEYLAALAEMLTFASRSPSNDAERQVKALFEDEQFRPGRRRLMPLEFTQGVPIYVFDLMINASYLPEQQLAGPLIPCLADPPGREPATVVHIPWYCTGTRDWLLMMGPEEDGKE